MMRRLLGPIGGPILFLIVTISVFGVLGWVTHSALRVEAAQREAAARAELGSNLRVALWRLDGRMLPALGVEYSRPYYQYGPADPMNDYGFAATPLLTTNLPDWMRLHFQLDAANGWTSPQILSDEIVERVRDAWGLPLQNVNGERVKVLEDLRRIFPARTTLEDFASRDRSAAGDAITFGLPGVAEGVPGPETKPVSQPQPSSEPLPKTTAGSLNASAKQSFIAPNSSNNSAPYNSKQYTYRLFGIELCLCSEFSTANNFAVNEARKELSDAAKKSENPTQPAPGPRLMQQSPGRGRMPTAKDENNSSRVDNKERYDTINRGFQEIQPPLDNIQPKNPLNYNLFNNSNPSQVANDGKMAGNVTPSANPVGKVQGNSVVEADKSDKRAAVKMTKDDQKRIESEQPFFQRLMDFYRDDLLHHNLFEPQTNHNLQLDKQDRKDRNDRETRPAGGMPTPIAPPPGNPLPNEGTAPATPAISGSSPLVNYLGSMRPQWVTVPDGPEMLVLVRTAKVDNKDVCQGIILDWMKLESMLKDEVKDLFPEAKLIPVKDSTEISPDRVMTALPIQLDPGPQADAPLAGLTTLRLGLLLAWAAAITAIGAVGFCGWTLIDLAERRIRFVSAVTHELRTPLTSLRLYLDMLVSGMIQDEAKKQEYLNTLSIESDRLHRLIDNVLDFARLEKRRKDGNITPVKMTDLIEQLRQTWSNRLTQEGRELVVISTLPVDLEVKTDAAMIQQIIGNLIDNARKYSHDTVDRRIWIWAKPNGPKSVLIEVEDRGPGVPANERRSVFKPFHRGEQADKTSGGAGLGLALAKSWAEVLGGKLGYRPAEGGIGACFRLELPVR